jgi:hypothetical protein
MSAARHLVIMAKQPKLGRVKTRLGRDIGPVEATRIYRVMLAGLLRRLGGMIRAGRHGWQWMVSMKCMRRSGRAACHVVSQGRGDLGQRMQHQFDSLPPGPVVHWSARTFRQSRRQILRLPSRPWVKAISALVRHRTAATGWPGRQRALAALQCLWM